MPNEHYHDLIWDYLYGLLDPPEAETLRAHVETCETCRTALTEAETQQKLVAQAARVIPEVPVFHEPGEDAFPSPVERAKPEAPTILPIPAGPRRRSMVWRVASACAAAVLLVVAF